MSDKSSKPDKSRTLTEAQYLDRQVHEAGEAISKVLSDMKHHLAAGADPRLWTQHYPFITLASAAVAGFLAGTGLVPSKEDQALKRLEKLERALHPTPPRTHAESNGDSHHDTHPPHRSILAIIGRELLHTLQPALLSALTAGLAARAARPNDNNSPESPPSP